MLQVINLLILPLVCLCSKVLDGYSQKAVIVSDYCPSIPGCPDGTHLMCLYYDPNKTNGPLCADVVNISVTAEYAQLIVDICNRIRSKVANGQGKGEGDSELPKGYGMLKLSWDPELATLAQVWANQCSMKLDTCRATKKFPNPGQIIGKSRYTVTTWVPISLVNSNIFNSTTITPDKITYAIKCILKAWYELKDKVTSDTIKYLDVNTHISHNQFLQLVNGRSSHMGCGMNGYREYSYSDNNAALNFNSIQIVCNFSHQPGVGEYVYITTPPTDPGYTMKCGCPLGYDEDEDCLCYEMNSVMRSNCKESGQCKPSVVVLPIFTVEDAPLNLLKKNHISGIIKTSTLSHHEKLKRIPFIDYTRSNKNDVQIIKRDSVYKTRRISTDVKNRYFGVTSDYTNKLKAKPPPGNHTRRNIHKQSIFAKAAVFELPSNHLKLSLQNTTYRKHVKPRKDFSKAHKLVSKYLEEYSIGHLFDKSKDNRNLTYSKSVTMSSYSSPNKVNMRAHNLSGFTKHKFTYMDINPTRTPLPKDEMKSLNKENDHIFMNLLDKLEEEVNNIGFKTKEKKMFDEKIRKIYGTLFKKPVVTEHSTVYRNISMNKDIFNNNIQHNVNRRNYWLDPNKPDEYTYRNLGDRPTNGKSMKKYYDKNDRDIVNNKYAKNYERLSHRNEPLYNENIEDRELRNMYPRKKSEKGNPRYDNYYLRSDIDEYSLLEYDRRRQFYDKLNSMQRKVSTIKNQGRQTFITDDLLLRPVRPSKPVYAKFLHGF